MIRKRITSAGNSAALLISQDLLALMGVAVGDEVELRLVDRSLLVRPLAESERKAKVGAAMDRVFSEHAGLLRRLARNEPAERERRATEESDTGERQVKPPRSPRSRSLKRA